MIYRIGDPLRTESTGHKTSHTPGTPNTQRFSYTDQLGQQENTVHMDSSSAHMFQAVKECEVKKCQQFIEEEGPSIVGHYDEKGHTPVHWAALAGSVELIGLFVDSKGPVDLPSQSESSQHPIHWAAVNGCIAVVDLLVKAGVSLDVEDQKGCTPLITAAQYGQTALCCYLIGKGAKVHLCDLEGDNALHWAAFKGHCELSHLLIYSGCNPRQTDNFGQTPLHLAVLSGNLPTVQLLCEQDGVELEGEDNNKNTPLRLAKGRKSKEIVSYLDKAITRSKNLNAKFDWSTCLFGRPGKSKGAILFFLGNLFLWGYPTYFFKIVPVSYNYLWEWHITFLLSNVLMWFSFLKASLVDPGFLLRDTEEYNNAVRQAINFNDWKNGKNPLSRLCHTCHLVKPLRSKHCRVTNRCVAVFDHYCPYVYNDVGQRNRVFFVGFLLNMCISCLIGVYLCWDWLYIEGHSLLIEMGFVFLAVIGFISAMMTGTCLYMAAVNITTNERMNSKKYSYLMDESGKFYNPFDRGLFLNLLEFCHFIPQLPEEKIKKRKVNEI
ncbi:probable protein S-acyltransferase 23 [Rana temporaria]|uniref:probable protein S-acyltransferase 23 n=1 Tax=Rana temporaria TaxID=8407 RepID=UPI001AAD1E52|nr:probable protein S-acyltransferase 23 [Rana temporaria]